MEDLQEVAERFGVPYYANFQLLVAPDPESPANKRLRYHIPTAEVYQDGKWRRVVIGKNVYRDSEVGAARSVLDTAEEAQKFLLESLTSQESDDEFVRLDILNIEL
ncbi:hypothetical protein A2926_01085 [Candidatus Giovannonibacteria bacterium RIFCSPLOWO2_01_FULL_44_40]|uniref:Uncharacterized protein n=1 Tax=Candidatus Giovannonibacteria bacterium RIFCSPHIGHO2_01_FULL_45_23 TaxID=1798325 RepID=A0A1F5VGN4_9BACT|nr:MAG: hypothetical protein A2834_02605 [Candidatus Giovannonibacteria bacterium RIFCSPHIGHO2_01_FULL_45_23]OGF75178.1 MAG: hypothetical protein A3C77_03795 [Candidatus Giovannonibacteria bacterium RIFCSPHIGHO2_02_FULL_45_13]OGF80031.1 MAG: hypothetical protein A2926_01085 [Candidatus Giovannonibacteria bacterium RIFCSPLOWO2_01_FULL_44_40]